MAYYCGECIVWRGSSDENRYGERWCSYSRRYERSDQNTYGCKGFLYAGRAVLTKVCEILHLNTAEWFSAFDEVKEAYVVPAHMDMLVDYCSIGPVLANRLQEDAERYSMAKYILKEYLTPARQMVRDGLCSAALEKYREMVYFLRERYNK